MTEVHSHQYFFIQTRYTPSSCSQNVALVKVLITFHAEA